MPFLVGRYKVNGILGQGGSGAVYEAEDQRLNGKRWAVKQVPTSRAEWLKLSALDHPNLPHISDYFEENGHGYIVMEYIDGETLQQRFERNGRRMDPGELLDCCLQLCDVLTYIHGQRPHPVIHRDLKPSNIMMDRHGRLKLIDFGIARHYKRGSQLDTQRLGTIGFAAPELIEAGRTSTRSDLYSVGAVLRYLVSGGSPMLPADGGCPEALRPVIARLLSREESGRYASAAELREELERVSGALVHSGRSKPAAPRKDNIGRCMIAVIGLHARAGSSTITLLLSACLRRCGVQHVVAEQPGITPTLHDRLGGERDIPAPYEFAVERIVRNGCLRQEEEWRRLNTVWRPLPPYRELEWSVERQMRFLYELASGICLLDMSHQWEDSAAEASLQCADHLVVVSEPLRGLNDSLLAQRLRLLDQFVSEGKSIRMIANKYAPFAHSHTWLNSLPDTAVHVVPEFGRRHALAADWSESIEQFDRYLCTDETAGSFIPLLQSILPKGYADTIRSERKLLFSAWRQRLQRLLQRRDTGECSYSG